MAKFDEAQNIIADAQAERDAWLDYCNRTNTCTECYGNGFFSTGEDWPFDTRDCRKCDGTGELS